MGGHGAMICHLKNPGMYSSVSAFSPIVNPTAVPWGEKVEHRTTVRNRISISFLRLSQATLDLYQLVRIMMLQNWSRTTLDPNHPS